MEWNIDWNQLSEEKKLVYMLKGCNYFLSHQSGCGQTQDSIIKMLMERGPLNQKAIQESLNITAASASEIITKLESRGLVERTRSKEDRRRVVLSLTEKGRHHIIPQTLEMSHYFDALSQEEKVELFALLSKLVKTWMGSESK